ncbi:unnamed protein product [Symbiodinium sp. KB8]|nr:unnamed protein product [Symbiodinium sp. KB8]
MGTTSVLWPSRRKELTRQITCTPTEWQGTEDFPWSKDLASDPECDSGVRAQNAGSTPFYGCPGVASRCATNAVDGILPLAAKLAALNSFVSGQHEVNAGMGLPRFAVWQKQIPAHWHFPNPEVPRHVRSSRRFQPRWSVMPSRSKSTVTRRNLESCRAVEAGGLIHQVSIRRFHQAFEHVSTPLGEGPRLVRTVEALWYMADDYESCMRIVDLNGHELLCQLAREHGQDNPDAAGGIFRLLAETLYAEPRSSRLWGEALDANLLAAAVNWAVQQAGCSDPGCSTTLGFVCDVAALWLQRVPDKEAAKPLIGIVPQLLKIMAFRLDDVLLLQHGFRLLWAFAHKSAEWLSDNRQFVPCSSCEFWWKPGRLQHQMLFTTTPWLYRCLATAEGAECSAGGRAPRADRTGTASGKLGGAVRAGGKTHWNFPRDARASAASNGLVYIASRLSHLRSRSACAALPPARPCTVRENPGLDLHLLSMSILGPASGAASAVASAASAATSAVFVVKERAAQVAPAAPGVTQLAAGAGEAVAEAGQRVRDAAGEVTHQVAGVAGHASSQVASAVEGVRDHAVQQKQRMEKVADQFTDLMEGFLKRKLYKLLILLVDKIPGILKTVLEDPEMPSRVQRAQDAAVDAVWPDVRQEIMWELAVSMDGKAADQPKEQGCICCSFLRYHLYPFDRGFWGRLRDPVWILFTIVGLLPVYGISPGIFLLIFLIVDKTDEFQLVSFILEFKGFQYLTQGLVRSLMGYFLYLNCVTAPGQEEDFCATNGPGSVAPTLIVLVGYLLQVVLVWTAFLLLPFSSRKGRSTLTGHLDEPLPHRAEHRGGYIIYLLWYDLLTFVVCAGTLVYVLQLREWWLDDWMVKHAFFAIQMVHGYLSMPFFFFTIPLIRNVLSHTAPTGYDRSGCCRQYLGPARPPKPPADAGNIPRVLEKAEAAKVLENLRRLLSGLRVRALDLEEQPTESEAANAE